MENLITVTNIKFNTKFSSTYLRNNRSSGQKSLRCFPDCCIKKGHEHFGFCGQSIITVIELRIPDEAVDVFNTNEPLFLLQLRPSKEPHFSKYSILSDEVLNSNTRTDTCKKGELIRGEARMVSGTSVNGYNDYVLHVEFNSKLNSWDYGWKSNRWSSEETHLVDVMVLVKGETHYHMVAKAESSQFTMVACKTCSKTTRIWDKDEDGEVSDHAILDVKSKKTAKPKKKLPKKPDASPEVIIDEVENLKTRAIDGTPNSSTLDIDEANDDDNIILVKGTTKIKKAKGKQKAGSSEELNDNDMKQKGNGGATLELNQLSAFNDRDQLFYYDNDEVEVVPEKKRDTNELPDNTDINNNIDQVGDQRSSKKRSRQPNEEEDEDSDSEDDVDIDVNPINETDSNLERPSREDVKRRYIKHLVERQRSIGNLMTVDYDADLKRSNRLKKLKGATATSKKKKRKGLDEDGYENYDIDEQSLYVRNYVSKKNNNDDDNDSDSDDEDLYNKQLAAKTKEKFDNLFQLAIEGGYYSNDAIDHFVASNFSNLDTLSNVCTNLIRPEKYLFDKNKILFSLASGKVDYSDPRFSSSPIQLPTMAH